MKKLLFFMFLFIGLSLSAQVQKNTLALSFNSFNPGVSFLFEQQPNVLGLAFSTVKYDEDDEGEHFFSAGLCSDFHYFLQDNFSAGLLLGAYALQTKEGSLNLLLSGGPELRYYIPLSTKINFYLKANGTYGWMNQRYEKEWSEYSMKSVSFAGGGGIAYFPASCVSIDFCAGYRHNNWKMEDESVQITSGIVFDIGFTLYIN